MGKFTFKILHYESLWCGGLDTPTRSPTNLNLSSVELMWSQGFQGLVLLPPQGPPW